MTVISEQVIERNGLAIRVLHFDDGGAMEMLASLSAEEQARLVERRQRPREAAPPPQAMNEDWREKTAFPLGMRDDGSLFQADEVKAFLQKVMAAAEDAEPSEQSR